MPSSWPCCPDVGCTVCLPVETHRHASTQTTVTLTKPRHWKPPETDDIAYPHHGLFLPVRAQPAVLWPSSLLPLLLSAPTNTTSSSITQIVPTIRKPANVGATHQRPYHLRLIPRVERGPTGFLSSQRTFCHLCYMLCSKVTWYLRHLFPSLPGSLPLDNLGSPPLASPRRPLIVT